MIKTLTKSIVLFTLLFVPLAFTAATVVISEVGFRSSASIDDYVELYNTTGSSINLSGYTLVPSSGSTVTLTGTIPANGFYVIGKNTTEASFESSWGVTIGGTSVYENSSNVLSTSAGVTFQLKNSGGTTLSNTAGYGITLGQRLYQCPVDIYAGNTLGTAISSYTPGSVDSKGVDDLTHWTLSIWGGVYQTSSVSTTTGSDNLIVKYGGYWQLSSWSINDVFLVNFSNFRGANDVTTISGDLYIGYLSNVEITGSGSLTVTGTIYQYRQGVNTNLRYNMWTTPFSNSVSLLATFTDANPCDLYAYEASTQTWKYDYSVPFTASCNGNTVTFGASDVIVDGTADGNFDIARGYFVPGSSSIATRTITGTALNNGNINANLYGSSVAMVGGNDWNIIGNPYPSGIRALDFLNNANNSSLFNAAYLYDGDHASYNTINLGNASSWYIASCQGFWVNPTSAIDGLIGTAQFTNSMRFRANWHWRNSNPTIFIGMVSDTLTDQIQIILDQDSQDGIDGKHDAFKMPNPNYFNLASVVSSELFVFNGIKPVEVNQTKTIKLFIETPRAGNFEIAIDSLNLIDINLDIKLEDRTNNTFTNLRDEKFTFTTQSADSITDRFFIHLTNTITSTSNLEADLMVSIFSNNDYLNINTIGETPITALIIYDLVGRKIYEDNNKKNTYEISTKGFETGVYIIKVTGANGKVTTKRIFIK